MFVMTNFQKIYGLNTEGIADKVTFTEITQVIKNEGTPPENKTEYTDYKLTLNEALDIQKNRPIITTDKYKNDPAFVSANYIDLTGNEAKANVNVRAGKGMNYHIWGQLEKGQKVTIINEGAYWHEIKYQTWREPTRADLKAYLDPSKNNKLQHLRLDSSMNVSATELNKVLCGKGILQENGQAFINGANQHGINEAYMIAHAFLESGHGTSNLAMGVEVGKNMSGNLVLVTSSNRNNLSDIKTTYNMFGIGAADSNPLSGGAITAYKNDWFTPADAIQGGAKWIGEGYVYNEHKQDTLYKMKWNPRMSKGYAWKQYATDIAWAVKQTNQITNIYKQLNNPSYHFDIPTYL